MRKVSETEIEKLDHFTRKHYVEYYDLQTELVDHLANGIEKRWKENPNLGFEKNLRLEFKKFGVFGFSDIVEKRKTAMEKKYLKYVWAETKQRLKQPQIFLSIFFLIIGGKLVLEIRDGLYVLSAVYLAFAIFLIVVLFRRQREYSIRKKKTGRVFLLEELIHYSGGAITVFMLPFHLIIILNDSGNIENIYGQWLIAIVATATFLLAYVCFYLLPKKKNEILKKAYPGMKIPS